MTLTTSSWWSTLAPCYVLYVQYELYETHHLILVVYAGPLLHQLLHDVQMTLSCGSLQRSVTRLNKV